MIRIDMLARNLKVAIFEYDTAEELELGLQEWFDSQEEAVVVAIQFDTEGTAGGTYRADVLYTE